MVELMDAVFIIITSVAIGIGINESVIPREDVDTMKMFIKTIEFPVLQNVTYDNGLPLNIDVSNIDTEEIIIHEWDNISEQDRNRIILSLREMGFVEQPTQDIIIREDFNSTRSNVS